MARKNWWVCGGWIVLALSGSGCVTARMEPNGNGEGPGGGNVGLGGSSGAVATTGGHAGTSAPPTSPLGGAAGMGAIGGAGATGAIGGAGATAGLGGTTGITAGLGGGGSACAGIICGSDCVDLKTNAKHCGACDRACSTSHADSTVCTDGQCAPTCKRDWGNAKTPGTAEPDDGCETVNCGTVGPSCSGLANCDESEGTSCCKSLLVPGGSYERTQADDTNRYPALVSSFCMDKYEVTVGRFRNFLSAYDAWVKDRANPIDGAGAHRPGAETGWRKEDQDFVLPVRAATFKSSSLQQCERPNEQTWSDTANDNLPINCVNWFEAFAFCIWDGGRLATEAEWEFAAGNGANNWTYPWGSPAPSSEYAAWGCNFRGDPPCGFSDILSVGSVPAGNARWGHSDLAGNMFEWVFDWTTAYPLQCDNCALATAPTGTDAAPARGLRGGSYDRDDYMLSADFRGFQPPSARWTNIGLRCVRSIE